MNMDQTKMQCERAVTRLTDELDRRLDNARDSSRMSREEICAVKDVLKALWYAKAVCKEA